MHIYCLWLTTTSESSLDDYIESQMQVGNIPSLSVAVVQNSSILYPKAFGYSNPNKSYSINATIDTIYTFASVSKTVTSFGVMSLYDKNLFGLDTNINNYLASNLQIFNPYFPNISITMRQLLTHTSSINDAALWKVYSTVQNVIVKGDSNITLQTLIYNLFDDINGILQI